MLKAELSRQIEASTGKGFLTISDIARYMGLGRDKVRNLMAGVDYLPSGRSKLYHVSDIAKCIYENKNVSNF